MKKKTHLRIGGVPEHFNLPWQLAAERDIFTSEDIDLAWTVYAGGTGAMTKALANGELDIAVLLTEGFIAAADQGLKARIAKVYIESPLIWGIYTSRNSRIHDVKEGMQGKYAISRYGSGSHLMAMIHASQHEHILRDEQFVVVNSLHGAVDSLVRNETQIFFWEKFMTRPHVKSGELALIGEFSAPWSSFLIICSDQVLKQKAEAVQKLLTMMNAECISFKQDNSSVVHLRKRFDMTMTEARNWLRDTQWNYDYRVEKRSLENAKSALLSVNMCNAKLSAEKLCAPWIKLI
jgi:ABC-type nitrate/sulfonate/bicarbonate transport system substrate-binding protein